MLGGRTRQAVVRMRTAFACILRTAHLLVALPAALRRTFSTGCATLFELQQAHHILVLLTYQARALCVLWRGGVQVRRVLDVMRGRSFEDAIQMMEYMPYRACEQILRALKSVSV
jgi:hypothetical protein